jgi:hypothetical protein
MAMPKAMVDMIAIIPTIELVDVSDSLLTMSSDICRSRSKLTPTAMPTTKLKPCC